MGHAPNGSGAPEWSRAKSVCVTHIAHRAYEENMSTATKQLTKATLHERLKNNAAKLRSIRRTGFAVITALGLCWQAAALSATYYVDPGVGSDANAGTTQTSAWKTLPGWGSVSTHGSFNSSSKIPVGSTIEIKAGTSLIGQRWQVNSTYYALPSSEADRITIRVSPTWGSGNFLIDGSGASVPLRPL